MEENNFEKVLDLLQEKLLESQGNWNRIIESLAKRVNCELKETIDLEAEAISYRQILIDEKSKYLFKIYKDMPRIKQLRKTQFEYYATKYQIKTNASEKTRLIDADIAFYEAKIEYLENHINFLTESMKTCDHVIWSVKSKIDMYNITGLD